MKITELIKKLNLRLNLYGDLDVKIHMVGDDMDDDPDLGCVFVSDNEVLILCDGQEIPGLE